MTSSDGLVLGDVVELQRGTTYKSALLGQPGPALLGLGSLQRDGGFRGDKLKTYGGESAEKILLSPGDLYVSLKDVTQSGDLLGAVARVPETVSQGRLTQDTVALRITDDRIPRAYLYWTLRSPEYRAHCRAHAMGTTNLSLSRDDFLAFPVPTTTPERLALVDLLELLEQKIVSNARLSDTLERTATAFFTSWQRRHAEGTEKLEEWVDLTPGRSYASKDLDDPATPNGLLTLKSVRAGGGFSADGVRRYAGRYKPAQVVQPGEIIVAHTDLTQAATILGRPALVRAVRGFTELIACMHTPVVRPKAGRMPASYLYFLLRSDAFHEHAYAHSHGSTVLMLNKKALGEFEADLVSEAAMVAFDELVAPMLSQIETLAAETETLASLRDAFMTRLVRGTPLAHLDSDGVDEGEVAVAGVAA
jgi:type I restriction enzyme S subunit